MITVSGNLNDIFGDPIPNATLVVQLCGFGATLPRVSAAALIAKTGQLEVNSTDGTFSFAVYGNDVIEPAGTYYTVTVKDENGDVVQTEAYQFVGASAVDLSTATPFDPVPALVAPGGMRIVTRVLNNAQIKALQPIEGDNVGGWPTTPFDLVVPSSPDKTIIPVQLVLICNIIAGYNGIGAESDLLAAWEVDQEATCAIAQQHLISSGEGNLTRLLGAASDVPSPVRLIQLAAPIMVAEASSSGWGIMSNVQHSVVGKKMQLGIENYDAPIVPLTGGDPANTMKATLLYFEA